MGTSRKYLYLLIIWWLFLRETHTGLVPDWTSKKSSENRSHENNKGAGPPKCNLSSDLGCQTSSRKPFTFLRENQPLYLQRPTQQSHRFSNHNKRLKKRQTFQDEITDREWYPYNATAVRIRWQGHGDFYHILLYLGYPVGGEPPLPIYNDIHNVIGSEYLLTGLKPNSDFLCHISARSHDGKTGIYKDFRKITTPELPAPINLEIVNVTDTSVTLQWEYDYGRNTEVEFAVRYRRKGSTGDLTYIAGSQTLATVRNLRHDMEYSFEVAATVETIDYRGPGTVIEFRTLPTDKRATVLPELTSGPSTVESKQTTTIPVEITSKRIELSTTVPVEITSKRTEVTRTIPVEITSKRTELSTTVPAEITPVEITLKQTTEMPLTSTEVNQEMVDSSINLSLWFGILGVLILIVILILLVWFLKKRCKLIGMKLSFQKLYTNQENLEIEEIKAERKSNRTFSFRKIPKEEFVDYLANIIDSQEPVMEFQSMPPEMKKSCSVGQLRGNRKKNQDQMILPYDDTRVMLPLLPNQPHSDYINASYIKGPKGEKSYIATQEPKSADVETIGDFWRMIWDNQSRVIIMVTNREEAEKDSVVRYWPNAQPITKGGIEVALENEEIKMDFKIRTFKLSLDEDKHVVSQYHFTNWPGSGVLLSCSALAEMIIVCRQKIQSTPIVVHSSKGRGATGPIILALNVLDQMETQPSIAVHEALTAILEGGSNLFGTSDQYHFAHRLLHEVLFTMSCSTPMDDFIQRLPLIRKAQLPATVSLIDQQYQKLKRLPVEFMYTYAMNPEFEIFNRDPEILPSDERMVPLLTYAPSSESLYINAVWVNGFYKKDRYIVTEHPMISTLDRVWRLVIDRKISSWFLLHTFPKGDEVFPSVLPPDDEPGNFGSVRVKATFSQSDRYFDEYITEVSYNMPAKILHICKVFQLFGWSQENPVPPSPEYLSAIAEKLQESDASSGPILFSCSDGVRGSGLAVASLLTIERIQEIREVNIYKDVLSLLYDRPEFISTKEQYHYLFDVAKSYILASRETTNSWPSEI